MQLRVFLIEPDDLRSRLLRETIAAAPALWLSGVSASARDVATPDADLLLVDTDLLPGEKTALQTLAERANAGVVLFSARPVLPALLLAMALPLRGFVAFDHLQDGEFARSLLAIGHGGAILDPYLTAALLSRLRSLEEPVAPGRPRTADLSLREIEVVALVRQGLSNKEIAFRLGISLGTVRAHLRSVFRKLDVSSRVGAALLSPAGPGPTLLAG